MNNAIPLGNAWAANTVNTAIFRHHGILTFGSFQFAAFYVDRGTIRVVRRKLADDSIETFDIGGVYGIGDAHNCISLGCDSDGFLHIAYDHHASRLRYRRSLAPLDITSWTEELPMTGSHEEQVTYPCFLLLPRHRKFLFLYRDGTARKAALRMKEWLPTGQGWTERESAVAAGTDQQPWTSSPYWNHPAVGSDGTIHLSFVWRVSHAIAGKLINNVNVDYCKSSDGGLTWRSSGDVPLDCPITQVNSETIRAVAPGSGLMNQCSMALDSRDRPHIAFFSNDADGIPQYQHLWFDGGTWQHSYVSRRTQPFQLANAGTLPVPVSRPEIVIDGEDRAYLIYRGDLTAGRMVAQRLLPPAYDPDPSDMRVIWDEPLTYSEPVIDRTRWQRDGRFCMLFQDSRQPLDEKAMPEEIQEPLHLLDIDLVGLWREKDDTDESARHRSLIADFSRWLEEAEDRYRAIQARLEAGREQQIATADALRQELEADKQAASVAALAKVQAAEKGSAAALTAARRDADAQTAALRRGMEQKLQEREVQHQAEIDKLKRAAERTRKESATLERKRHRSVWRRLKDRLRGARNVATDAPLSEEEPVSPQLGADYSALKKSSLFDAAWYSAQYPDVARPAMDPMLHYLRYGAAEGRDPSPDFDTRRYLKDYPDVQRAGVNPLLHFFWRGTKEGRKAYPVGKPAAPVASAAPAHLPIPAKSGVRTVSATAQEKPLVSIIILNRDGAGLLDAMLRSFFATNTYPNYEILIVDHGSTDSSLELLGRWGGLREISVTRREENFSFSHSNNSIARSANGELLLLLNNDIVFTDDVLEGMVAALETPETGAVGLKQFVGTPGKIEPRKIHHIGIRYRWDPDGRFLRPWNQTAHGLDQLLASNLAAFPAITAAIMLCRKNDYLAVGGLDEGYFYGFEDVDFCCKIRFGLGKETVSLNRLHAFHNESATRKLEAPEEAKRQRFDNRERLKARFGYRLRRDFLERLCEDDGSFIGKRLSVGIAVTTTDMAHGAGDLFTAYGLGESLRALSGWNVRYLTPSEWYDAAGLDVFISMRDDVDIRRLKSAEPHLITVAWMRNWLERWCAHPWFHHFDIHLSSSKKGADFVWQSQRIRCGVFPIAVDQKLFSVGPAHAKYECDYVFTGNYWRSPVPREIEDYDPASVPYKLSIYGKNWEHHPAFAPYNRGFVDYRELPKIYASAPITIDDAVAHATKIWGSVNSRVFEALAVGSLVLSNNVDGAEEVFDKELPCWKDVSELAGLVSYYSENGEERRALAAKLRKRVLEEHTYDIRAKTLKEMIAGSFEGLRIAIKCPAPSYQEAPFWGDYHFARSLKRALTALGYSVRIDLIPEWYAPRSVTDDVVIVLRGLTTYTPSCDQINLCWLISHPDRVTDEELERYDHVFVASADFTEKLRTRLKVPVSPLLQCSDPEVFFPPDSAQRVSETLLFVGNSRKQRRKIVFDCLAAGLPIAVYGRDWEAIPADMVRDAHVENNELHRYYGGAKIVLNDHWPDMAANGFVSNRIFDAALAGSFVLSDSFAGEEIFEGAMVTYRDQDELTSITARWLDDDMGRKEMADRLRQLVLKGHTFADRATAIAEVIQAHHERRVAFTGMPETGVSAA